MKKAVAGVRVGTFKVVLHVAFKGFADARQFFIAGIDRGQCRRFGLDQTTSLKQGERWDFGIEVDFEVQLRVQLFPLIARGLGHHRFIGQRLHRWFTHQHPVTDTYIDQPDDFQRDHRLAHRRTTHAKQLGKLAFGGQTAARGEFTAVDQGPQLVGNLPIKSLVINYLKWHCEIGSGMNSDRRSLLAKKDAC